MYVHCNAMHCIALHCIALHCLQQGPWASTAESARCVLPYSLQYSSLRFSSTS
jgi:hypothetical protein